MLEAVFEWGVACTPPVPLALPCTSKLSPHTSTHYKTHIHSTRHRRALSDGTAALAESVTGRQAQDLVYLPCAKLAQ